MIVAHDYLILLLLKIFLWLRNVGLFRENKISSYEIQLSSLKSHITQLQDDFGEFDNLEELHDMVIITWNIL